MPNDSVGRILIVDDEASITALLRGWIATSGFDIELASNGKEAIEVARTYLPDAILMDASMPVMGGFEALLSMKKDPVLCKIPVLFLTVRNDVQDVVNALDIGATDYLTKPFKPQVLLARLRSAVRLKKSHDALQKKMNSLSASLEALSSFFDQLDYGALLTTSDGTVLQANAQAARLLGKEAQAMTDTKLSSLIESPDASPCPTQEMKAFQYLANGCEQTLQVIGTPLQDRFYLVKMTVESNC